MKNYVYLLEFIIAGLLVVILDIFSKKLDSKYSGILTSMPLFFLLWVYLYRNKNIENYIYNCIFSNFLCLLFVIILYYLVISKNIKLKLNNCIYISIFIWIILSIIFFNYIFI